MSARIESKYPGEPHDYKVVVWECPTCGARQERDHDARWDQLQYIGESDCDECQEVRRTSPLVYAFVKRLVDARFAVPMPSHALIVDVPARVLEVRNQAGEVEARFELVPAPGEKERIEQRESDQRLHKAVEEHIVESAKRGRFIK